jgi:hypothetical protein
MGMAVRASPSTQVRPLLGPVAVRRGRHCQLAMSNDHGVLGLRRSCSTPSPRLGTDHVKQAIAVLYILAMVAMVVGVDVLFLRHQFSLRLIVNVGIVLVFAAFYLRFLKHP